RARRAPAAGRLRVCRLHALLSRLPAASRDPGRVARPQAADAAQRLVPARVVPRGAPCDHRASLRGILRGGTRATRLGHGAEDAGGGAVSEAEITVVWIAGIALLSWFLFVRPRRRMMSKQRDLLRELSSGDQVV